MGSIGTLDDEPRPIAGPVNGEITLAIPVKVSGHGNIARNTPFALDVDPVGTLDDEPRPIAGPPNGEVALTVPVKIRSLGAGSELARTAIRECMLGIL